jgi:hypothetical protein
VHSRIDSEAGGTHLLYSKAPAIPLPLTAPTARISCMLLRHEFPQWHPQDLSRIFPTLQPEGVDLLKKMIEFDPAKRISVGFRPFCVCEIKVLRNDPATRRRKKKYADSHV